MKRLGALFVLLMVSTPVMAESLEEALVRTYQSNSELKSARKSTMATDELVPQALSGWRPLVSAGASVSYTDASTRPDASTDGTETPKEWDLSIIQPLYKGGSTVSSTKSAESNVKASHENLRATENEVLLSAVEAYVDVIRDQAIVQLNKKNLTVLEKNLEATTARFEVGELTRTDVSQSKASVSDAEAELVTAQGNLNSSIANYKNITGSYPKDLKNPGEKIINGLSKEEAVELALRHSPKIISTAHLDNAAQEDVKTVFAELLPEVDVIGAVDKRYDPTSTIDDVRSSSITASLTVPLYKSGAASSRIRQAKHNANQKRLDVLTAKRQVEADTVTAWENYEAAKSNIEARKAQIEANEIALKGVEEEEQVGARNILDVLDAEQEFLDSKVELVKAERNEIFGAYELLSKIGSLTAKDLNLPVEYWNSEDNYSKVRNKWWGTKID